MQKAMTGRTGATALALCLLAPAASIQANGPSKARPNTFGQPDCATAKSTPVASFPFNPFLLSELSPPVIQPAGAWRAELQTTGLGSGVAYLIAARRPAFLPTQGGMLLVDPADARILAGVPFQRGQAVRFSLPIPNRERLCSHRIRVQAVILSPGETYLTNAFDLTLGR